MIYTRIYKTIYIAQGTYKSWSQSDLLLESWWLSVIDFVECHTVRLCDAYQSCIVERDLKQNEPGNNIFNSMELIPENPGTIPRTIDTLR